DRSPYDDAKLPPRAADRTRYEWTKGPHNANLVRKELQNRGFTGPLPTRAHYQTAVFTRRYQRYRSAGLSSVRWYQYRFRGRRQASLGPLERTDGILRPRLFWHSRRASATRPIPG